MPYTGKRFDGPKRRNIHQQEIAEDMEGEDMDEAACLLSNQMFNNVLGNFEGF